MTQERFNYAGRYFRYVFGRLRVCFVFSVIFSAFCIPPFCLSHDESSTAVQAIQLALSLISLGGLLAVNFAAPLIAMKHLYAKTEADNILSLPLTAAQRYFCELGALFLCLAVPFAAISIPFSAVVQLSYLPIAVRGIFAILMLCVFQVFFITLCGRLTEAVLYPLALNILIPLAIWFGMHLGMMNIFGCGYDFTLYDSYSATRVFWFGVTLIVFLSPFGNFAPSLGLAFDPASPVPNVAGLLFLAVFIPLGLLLYKKRPAENIGRSFVYPKTYAITSVTVAVFAVICFYWAAENYLRNADGGKGFFNLVPAAVPVLVGGLFFLMLMMELVNYKKVKSFPRLLVRCAGVLAAGTLVSFVLYESDGFGESAYIPAADETLCFSFSSVEWSRDSSRLESSVTVMVEGDSALAEELRAVHGEMTLDRENGMRYESGREGASLAFTYFLKNGQIIRRYYSTDIPGGVWKKVVESEEYRYSDLLWTDHSLGYQHIYDVTERYRKLDQIEPIAVRLSPVAFRDMDRFGNRRNGFVIKELDYSELRGALYADLKNDTAFGRHEEFPIGLLEVGRMEEMEAGKTFIPYGDTLRYTIYESYTNTIALLNRYAEVPSEEELRNQITDRYEYFTLVRVPINPSNQDVLSATWGQIYFASVDKGMGEALITGEQYLEALSHEAQYVYRNDERDYVYMISCGAPNAMDGTVKTSLLRSGVGEAGQLINEEFYPVLDEWYEKGFVPPKPADGVSSEQ